MKRRALQNKRVGDLRIAYRARKVFGTYEKWAICLLGVRADLKGILKSHFPFSVR